MIQNMLKDRSLVEFICETVLKAVSRRVTFKTLMSFYAAVMLQYIATLPAITDEVLTAIFPYILEGLKAKGSPEYQVIDRTPVECFRLHIGFSRRSTYHRLYKLTSSVLIIVGRLLHT